MPQTIEPKGLDAKRQWYLYDEIRPFTAECCQDITTPLPAVPKTQKQRVEAVLTSDSDDDIPPPPPKSSRGRGRKRKGVPWWYRQDDVTGESPETKVLVRATQNNSSFQS